MFRYHYNRSVSVNGDKTIIFQKYNPIIHYVHNNWQLWMPTYTYNDKHLSLPHTHEYSTDSRNILIVPDTPTLSVSFCRLRTYIQWTIVYVAYFQACSKKHSLTCWQQMHVGERVIVCIFDLFPFISNPGKNPVFKFKQVVLKQSSEFL